MVTKRITKAAALAELQRLLGKDAGLKDYGAKYALTDSQRNELRVKLHDMKMHEPHIPKLEDTQYDDMNVAEFRALLKRANEQWREWRKERDNLSYTIRMHRYSAGTVSKFFFVVEAEADTLEELLTLVREKKAKK